MYQGKMEVKFRITNCYDKMLMESEDQRLPIELRGSWYSLLDCPLPLNLDQVIQIRLSHLEGDVFTRLTIFFDDFAGFNQEQHRTEPIETNGTVKEAIEKSSYRGRPIEISRCGTNLYAVVLL